MREMILEELKKTGCESHKIKYDLRDPGRKTAMDEKERVQKLVDILLLSPEDLNKEDVVASKLEQRISKTKDKLKKVSLKALFLILVIDIFIAFLILLFGLELVFIPHALKTPALKPGMKAKLRDSAHKPLALARMSFMEKAAVIQLTAKHIRC